MENDSVCGKTKMDWVKEFPLLNSMILGDEVFWVNPHYTDKKVNQVPLGQKEIDDAEARLLRFAPYLAKAFPVTKAQKGLIESPLVFILQMQKFLEDWFMVNIPGKLLVKEDNLLPIAGSIKARGGIYEVLKHSEDLALENQLLAMQDDYSVLSSSYFKEFFAHYSIAVGSTGNLGLSIGIMSSKLGYQVCVHMSADAKQWKKDMLRSQGVQVLEYDSDYSRAVEEGRKIAQGDPNCYFIDDENSEDLFLGYAVAASGLKEQLEDMNVSVDKDHPLFVYLPCGVGGGPGGIAFGLKLIFGEYVHCFFAEPTHSPCMLLGLLTGLHNQAAVQDFGIDNQTEADGLAVGRPSGFVSRIMKNRLSGSYTVQDDVLYILLSALNESEHVQLEPSALAGMVGPVRLMQTKLGQDYLSTHNLMGKMKNATHIVWATGGSLVPREIMAEYIEKGNRLTQQNKNH
ncbi:D-serine dehydratase [Desulfitobacterium metallireducens DSM 15288]|uniref:Probable D-serine dehydratase n=2 Tax=Desulfitobacterium TaxID=36853 RepID=W0ECJ9_9FIRM|nr:D-serine dehydratase [Desulfitobacterium metallireducens DSM 15288]